jgi:hypothetical protein
MVYSCSLQEAKQCLKMGAQVSLLQAKAKVSLLQASLLQGMSLLGTMVQDKAQTSLLQGMSLLGTMLQDKAQGNMLVQVE